MACGESLQRRNNKYHHRPPLYPSIFNIAMQLYPTSLNLCERANYRHSPSCSISAICRSRSVCFLSPVCAICAWFSSTPRLPVASYKNSFSMTEWRIRLEGSGQSSGTPFKNVCPALIYFCSFISAPCVKKKKYWTMFPLLLSHCWSFSEIIRNFNTDSVFLGYWLLLLPGLGIQFQLKLWSFVKKSSLALWLQLFCFVLFTIFIAFIQTKSICVCINLFF